MISHSYDGDILVPKQLFDMLKDSASEPRKALFEAGIHAWWDEAGHMPRMCYHERAARLKDCVGSYGVCAPGSVFINDHEQTYVDVYSVDATGPIGSVLGKDAAGPHVLHSGGRLQ